MAGLVVSTTAAPAPNPERGHRWTVRADGRARHGDPAAYHLTNLERRLRPVPHRAPVPVHRAGGLIRAVLLTARGASSSGGGRMRYRSKRQGLSLVMRAWAFSATNALTSATSTRSSLSDQASIPSGVALVSVGRHVPGIRTSARSAYDIEATRYVRTAPTFTSVRYRRPAKFQRHPEHLRRARRRAAACPVASLPAADPTLKNVAKFRVGGSSQGEPGKEQERTRNASRGTSGRRASS